MANKLESTVIPLALRLLQRTSAQVGHSWGQKILANTKKPALLSWCLLELSWNASFNSTTDQGQMTGKQGQTIFKSQLLNCRGSSFHMDNVSGGGPGEQVQLPPRDRCKIYFQWKHMFNEDQFNFVAPCLAFFATCSSGYIYSKHQWVTVVTGRTWPPICNPGALSTPPVHAGMKCWAALSAPWS